MYYVLFYTFSLVSFSFYPLKKMLRPNKELFTILS